MRDVVRGLYEGRYVAGQRLAEPDLMRSYGVARSTVREAIKRLVAEGVLSRTVPGAESVNSPATRRSTSCSFSN